MRKKNQPAAAPAKTGSDRRTAQEPPTETSAPSACPSGDRLARWKTVLMCFVLAGAVLGAFLPVAWHGFLNFDDQFYVTDNPQVKAGLCWNSVLWALQDGHLGTWHPLTWLSHLLDVQLFGLSASGHHLTSLGLHLADTLLLFVLLHRLTGTFWRAALAAALFALHPLHVESVAWISERKDVLSTFFLLLTLLAYTAYAEAHGPGSGGSIGRKEPGSGYPGSRNPGKAYVWALIFFCFGLMSKPMLVTVPLVLLLLDYWPLRRLELIGIKRHLPALLWEKAPFFALAAADGLLTLWTQRNAGAIQTVTEVPLGSRAANAAIAGVRYLWQTVWPADLAVYYPLRLLWPGWLVLGAVVMLLGLGVACMVAWRRWPWLTAGWLWYCITIVPVIGLIQVGAQASADRYTYVPLIGIFIAVAWTAGEIAVRIHREKVVAACCIGLAALALWRTRAQVGYWSSSETLFRHTLAVTRDNPLAHHCLGCALLEQGQFEPAAREFRRALALKPDYEDAAVSLGITLLAQGNLPEAEGCLRGVLSRNPRSAEAHYRLANALNQKGNIQEAVAHYQEAVRLKPELGAAQNNLGNALQRLGRAEEAIPHYRAALGVMPDLAEAHNNLGRALAVGGKISEAMDEYLAALRCRRDYAEAYCNLGNALAVQSRLDEAVAQYSAALQCKPAYPKAENSLGCALAMQGRTDDAIKHFTKALSLDPNDVEAHFNLGNALAKQGKIDEARQHLSRAVQLRPGFTEAQRQLDLLSTQPTPPPSPGKKE